MNVKLFLVVFCLLLLSLDADAASHRKIVFAHQYDLDGDWLLYAQEIEHASKKCFNITDENIDRVVNEEMYVFEYQNRMDKQIAKIRRAGIKQTYVRFDALNTDNDGQMTLKEYHFSGDQSFNRWDINQDNIVSMNEELPKRKMPKPSQPSNLELARAQVAFVHD